MTIDQILLIIIAVEIALIGIAIIAELQKINKIAGYFFNKDWDRDHFDPKL